MKVYKIILLVLLFLSQFKVRAQNLVLNPSFEDVDSCISNLITDMPYWHNPIYTPTGGNYINCNYFDLRCASMPSTPILWSGYEYPFDGEVFAGVGVSGYQYLVGTLASPLSPNTCYKFTMRVSLAERSRYSISNWGIYFSSAIPSHSVLPMSFTPQIVFNQHITDTSGWTTITRYYFASGGEQYLTIGLFTDFASNDMISVRPPDGSGWDVSMYCYVDMVELEEVSLPFCPK